MVLKAVSLGPLHGYGVLLRIQQISGNRLDRIDKTVGRRGFLCHDDAALDGMLSVCARSSQGHPDKSKWREYRLHK
jgi:hypothetical protein